MSVCKSIILLTLIAVAFTVANPQAAAAQQTAPASALAVFDVADRAAILVAHGVGAQIYECEVGETAATNWVFREPVATLNLGDGTISHHYVGPTWELTDGEVVKGKQSAAAPGATAGDVALLKLNIVEHRGSGILEDAKLVLRLTTRGGVLKGACPPSLSVARDLPAPAMAIGSNPLSSTTHFTFFRVLSANS
jgi:hypothetical protein